MAQEIAFEQVRCGGKAEVAAALSQLERHPNSDAVIALLDAAYAAPKAHTIGITGPPGAGKSTLIDALIAAWRAKGATVAVLAVDPSSRASGGALLGDRVRMRTDPADQGVFVRSIAARGRLGGLADIAYPAAVLMRALYDKVIVESVGVGQSETEIAQACDTTVLCVQPGSGDSLQFMKAGIAEIPDIAVVTKADMGAVASRALADVKGALSLAHRTPHVFMPRCLAVSATHADGLDTLEQAFDAHAAWLTEQDRLASRRKEQARFWIEAEIMSQFGRQGLALLAPLLTSLDARQPFHLKSALMTRIRIVDQAQI